MGLFLHLETNCPLDGDHALAVAFGGRPRGFENSIGHFANPLPVKIPVLQHLLGSSGSNTFSKLVASVSRNISAVKKAERLSLLDLARGSRCKGHDFRSPQVAVSYSPKLSNDNCQLFPVEGDWDLFFVFLDCADGVELGVCSFPPARQPTTTRR